MENATEVTIAYGYMTRTSLDGTRITSRSLQEKEKEKTKVEKEKERGKANIRGEDDPHPQEDNRLRQVLSYHQGQEENPHPAKRMLKFADGISKELVQKEATVTYGIHQHAFISKRDHVRMSIVFSNMYPQATLHRHHLGPHGRRSLKQKPKVVRKEEERWPGP